MSMSDCTRKNGTRIRRKNKKKEKKTDVTDNVQREFYLRRIYWIGIVGFRR